MSSGGSVKVRVKNNNKGFRQLRTSQWAIGRVMHEAKAWAGRAGTGYDFRLSGTPRNRAHATVYPDTYEAEAENARDNTLIRRMTG